MLLVKEKQSKQKEQFICDELEVLPPRSTVRVQFSSALTVTAKKKAAVKMWASHKIRLSAFHI